MPENEITRIVELIEERDRLTIELKQCGIPALLTRKHDLEEVFRMTKKIEGLLINEIVGDENA